MLAHPMPMVAQHMKTETEHIAVEDTRRSETAAVGASVPYWQSTPARIQHWRDSVVQPGHHTRTGTSTSARGQGHYDDGTVIAKRGDSAHAVWDPMLMVAQHITTETEHIDVENTRHWKFPTQPDAVPAIAGSSTASASEGRSVIRRAISSRKLDYDQSGLGLPHCWHRPPQAEGRPSPS